MRNISGLIFILSLITTWGFAFYAKNYISQLTKSFDGVLILTDQAQRNIYIIGAITLILALIVIISAILTLIKTIQIGFRKKDPAS